MRIFIGIDLDLEVRAQIERFLEGVQGFAPEARWVRPESLHITLKFIGEQPAERVEAITERLQRVESCAFEIRSAGYGFFPTAKAPRVFWIGINGGSQLAELAGAIDAATAELGIPPEDRGRRNGARVTGRMPRSLCSKSGLLRWESSISAQ